jgi:hypothetical protein
VTRQCTDCKIIMGEKCSACGSQSLILLNRGDDLPPDMFECHNHHIFEEGEGGVTHGICDPCLEKRRQEVLEQTA